MADCLSCAFLFESHVNQQYPILCLRERQVTGLNIRHSEMWLKEQAASSQTCEFLDWKTPYKTQEGDK